jgi:RNA polymerase sigma-70 factor (ECF subfamily)
VGAPPDDPRSDEQLIGDISSGDLAAFDVLYCRYRDWVFSLAYRFTLRHEDALDVLQETFAYLCRKLPNLTLTASMKTFLYPAIRNIAIELRRKRLKMPTDEHIEVVPAPPSAIDDRADLATALGNLSSMHREVVLLRFVDDLSMEEIALSLQVPVGTVKSRLYHALQTLREDPRARRYFQS